MNRESLKLALFSFTTTIGLMVTLNFAYEKKTEVVEINTEPPEKTSLKASPAKQADARKSYAS